MKRDDKLLSGMKFVLPQAVNPRLVKNCGQENSEMGRSGEEEGLGRPEQGVGFRFFF